MSAATPPSAPNYADQGDLVVVVLAAGDVRRRLPHLRGAFKCPALLPAGLRSAATCLAQLYTPRAPVLFMVNDDDVTAVTDELMGHARQVRVVGVRSRHVVDTLRQALAHLPPATNTQAVLVNLVTTLPQQVLDVGEVLLGQPEALSQRWSWIEPQAEPAHDRVDLHGAQCWRKGAVPAERTGLLPFTGTFCLTRGELEHALAHSDEDDLLDVVRQALTRQPLQGVVQEWIDLGHDFHHPEARGRLMSSRDFNRIEVDTTRGLLRKRSRHAEKFRQELAFVQMLPPGLAQYFPRVTRTQEHADGSVSADMEYYSYPTVAELALYWELDDEEWTRLFRSLRQVLSDFRAQRYAISPVATRGFYQGKLAERLAAYHAALDAPLRERLQATPVWLNGRALLPVKALQRELEVALEELHDERHHSVMHGDFCFGNILYDPASGIVRLLDPRGSYGPTCVGIFGDAQYDMAKLAHSAVGQYDYLVAGLFDITDGQDGLSLRLGQRANQALLERLTRQLAAELGMNWPCVQLIMALLFLSMTPLHTEDPRRQLAMYLHGLKLLNDALVPATRDSPLEGASPCNS